MSIGLQGLLALMPIIVVAVFLVGLRWPASKAMPLSYVTVVIIGYFVWGLSGIQILGGTFNGIIVAVTLLYIIFGSILVLYTIMESGGLHQIRASLMGITGDRRIQVIIVAWCFSSFIEGASGFGTPAAVGCPLMLGLGFPAFAAVISGMIIQSTPVSFGACGTPMRVGVGTGLGQGNDEIVNQFADKIGFPIINGAGQYDPNVYNQFISFITHRVSLMHTIGGFLIPLLLCAFLTRLFGKNKSYSEGIAVWPFAIFAAFANTIPMNIINFFVNYELNSMVGALTGLVIVITAAKAGFLMPKEEWDFLDKKDWDPSWNGSIDIQYVEKPGGMSSAMAWAPYGVVVLFILITRLVKPVTAFFNSITIHFPTVGGISPSFGIGYSPGTIFIAASIITFFMHGM
ncbi:MAG: L-lactate permease, partial [Eubacteriales bacterium]